MRRRLKVLALCAAALLAAHMMGQDTGGPAGTGGAGGDTSGGTGDTNGMTSPDTSGGMTSPDTSGGASGTGGTGGDNTNGGTSNPNTSTGTGTQNGSGAEGTTTPGTGTEGTGEGTTIVPPSSPTALPPGFAAPVPGTTPAPTPSVPAAGGGQGGTQAAPITFTLPGGYGGDSGSKSFTLGQGRLSKPPITFSLSLSEGYDNNIFSADSHTAPTPNPTPKPTPIAVVTGFAFNPNNPPTFLSPVVQFIRPKTSPTPKPVQQLGVIGSPVSTANLGIQIQKGTPLSVITADISLGGDDYWSRPGTSTDFTGNMDLQLVQRVTPRLSFSIDMFAVYQQTPNFALINAPTNNGSGGNYLNGNIKVNLSYAWTARLSTVTSYDLAFNLLQVTASSNQYSSTLGTQFRYSVSPRNTVTAEFRIDSVIYPSASAANSTSTFYLLGLNTFFSSRLQNSFSVGIQSQQNANGGNSQILPDFESDTTLALPRGANLSWSNSYGLQPSGNASQTETTYRTGLSYSQPLSTKLVASLSIAYNYVLTTNASSTGGSTTQNQLQASLGLGYTISPRLSLNMSYSYLEFLDSVPYTSYNRDQFFLGGQYQFR